jgi:uncharacterized membrane protein
MWFLPISLVLLILFILLLPALFFLAQAGILGIAFAKLGLSPASGILFFLACLIGSGINLPIRRRPVVVAEEDLFPTMLTRFFGFRVPQVSEQVLAVNVGGAILPVLLCLYLLPQAPFLQTLIATVIVAVVARALSRPVAGAGIALPALIPPIVSALVAAVIVPGNSAPTAYIAGVIGTLVGADLLNLNKINRMGRGVMSIGGAGVFDGIFLVGVFAVILS